MKTLKNFINKDNSYKSKNDFKHHLKEILKNLVKSFEEYGIIDISNIEDIDKWENDIIEKANNNGLKDSLKLLYLNWAYNNFTYKDIENIKIN